MKSAREIAFLAVASVEKFSIQETLQSYNLSFQDRKFARELAMGVIKRLLTIKYFANQLTKKLRLNRKEKALLFCGIYQYAFMKKVPIYAIVDETTSLAKKYFGIKKSQFFHAILRKLETLSLTVPGKNNAFDLSLRLSYPPYFIKKMLEEYGLKKTIECLESMNEPPLTTLRLIRGKLLLSKEKKGLKKLYQDVYISKGSLDPFLENPHVYIQNVTSYYLFTSLEKASKIRPKTVLDMAASPGGKLLLASEAFPNAELYANDVSEKKLEKIRENLQKYQVSCELTTMRGESFKSDRLFDLIILDVPCSNSGVYHKRAEARWRCTPESLEELSDLQADILENAARYLAKNGEIWYMTCSILESENEDTVEFAESLGLKKGTSFKVLPNRDGWDGGFAVSFRKTS